MTTRTVGSLLSRDLAKGKMIPNQLAKVSGVHRQRIADYINKDTCPDDDNLQKMLKVIPKLTLAQKEQYWKAQKRQKSTTSSNRKRTGKQNRIDAATRRIANLYNVSIDFGNSIIEVEGDCYDSDVKQKNVEQLTPLGQLAEIAFINESVQEQQSLLIKRKAELKGIPVAKGDMVSFGRCIITLSPKEDDLPVFIWKIACDSLDQGEQPAGPSLEIDGMSGAKSNEAKAIRKIVNQNNRIEYVDVFCFVLDRINGYLQLQKSKQEEDDDHLNIPSDIVYRLIVSFNRLKPYLKGEKDIKKDKRLVQGGTLAMQQLLDELRDYELLEGSNNLVAGWMSKYFEFQVDRYIR